MHKKFLELFKKEILRESIQNIERPVSEQTGDFLLEDDLEINANLFICAGLYQAANHKATVSLRNNSAENQTFSLDYPLEITPNNFECPVEKNELNFSETYPGRFKKLKDQLRLDHLNIEERDKITSVIEENQDIFHLDSEPLTATNVVKHKLLTHDEIPVYQKSYRYPHCHREEVCKQIQKMLKENIIQHPPNILFTYWHFYTSIRKKGREVLKYYIG
jgi:hypothetical protein